MDYSSDWFQGSIHEESAGLDSSSPPPPPVEMLITCSRPLMERRLRPPQDQALNCPRCDSTHTKFCYYNNYSLAQPRYFCKTCRRYWTKGGTLRNIPVGGGCRKNNKKVSSKKSHNPAGPSSSSSSSPSSSHHDHTDLHLSFPEMQFSHFGNVFGTHGTFSNPNFMDDKYNAVFENPRPIDFMESKSESVVGSSRNYDLMGNNVDIGMVGGGLGNLSLHRHHHHHHGLMTSPNVHNLCSPFGMSLDGNGGTYVDNCQRLIMLPHDHAINEDQNAIDYVKPNTKFTSLLDWQDQAACSDDGYLGNLGSSWRGMINGYGSSATNSLV